MASLGANANPGEIIAGRYRIEAWVGQGNMAMVFRATHLGTGRVCALKLVHAHLVERPEICEMFVQEARVGARIGKNPYIVDVFDAGVDTERGVPFLAMDLLEGTTLDKYIKQYGQMPPGLLKTLWLQLADALEQAHAAGVVHRDLKPGNLFLTYDRKGNPQLRVVDFGIAKLMEEGIQRTATQIGTPAYAAPEQLGSGMRKLAAKMGHEVASTISPATDIWSLGVITYELLIGARAGQLWTGHDQGTVTDLLVLVTTGPTPSATEQAGTRSILLPPGFDVWLERCLEKNASHRWPTIEMAVQKFVDLFDTATPANKLKTVRLPPVSTLVDTGKRMPDPTLVIPAENSENYPASHPVSQTNGANSGLPSSAKSEAKPALTNSRAIEGSARFDSLSGSAPSSMGSSRIDATTLGVASTSNSKRIQRRRKLNKIAIGVLLLMLPVSIYGLVRVFEESTKKLVVTAPPTLSATASVASSVIVEVRPAEPPAPIASQVPTSPIVPAPSASLWGKPPVPQASSSAAPSSAPITSVATQPPKVEGTATLNINSVPVSNVIVDGKPIGNTPKLGISVSAGDHRVVFIHPDKGKKSASVTLKPGETKTVAMKF